MVNFKDKLKQILYPPGVTVIDPRKATALFLILFSAQLTLTTPFSYLPAMVSSFGYTDRDRGYYAGMIASSLFVGRFFGGYFWGWLADKIGRRPVLIISASATYVATVAFGFTTSLWWALTTRFLQGLFNGVIVCGRAAFAEICDDTNQAIGVSLVFAAWNSAIVLGPALGGFLATPVKKYPNAFKGVAKTFFEKFAFLLPSVLISCMLLIALVMVYFLFEETKPNYDEEQEKLLPSDDESSETFHIVDDDKTATIDVKQENVKEKKQDLKVKSIKKKECQEICDEIKSWSIWDLFRNKIFVLVALMFGISGFCIIGFSELRSLWMATNIKYGGLSFTTDKIGLALLFPALFAVIIQPIIFGRLERKIGGIWTLRITLVILMACTLGFPNIHFVNNDKPALWSLLAVLGIFRLVADISSRSCLALFINNAVYRHQTGRANGLAFSVQEILRVASPTLFGSLFAYSINPDKHKVQFPVDFRLPFLIIGIVVGFINILSFFLPKSINSAKQPSKPSKCGEEAT